jgi:cob(I)alamin adenosyltransferase
MTARIYTRGGDSGATSHPGGGRVPKSHPHVELVGALDELNSHLGMAAAHLAALALPALDPVDETVRAAQREIFGLTAALFREAEATIEPPGPAAAAPPVVDLERKMDALDADLPPLASFILPGGRVAAASLHVARTVARRAERALAAAVPSPAPYAWRTAQAYLNRLADYLFVAARAVNHAAGEPDVRLRD